MRKITQTIEEDIIGNELSSNIGLKKIRDGISRQINDILNTTNVANEKFLEIISGLSVGDKISVNGVKGSVISFKTKGNQKVGVIIGTGDSDKITIRSAESAITNKMNILRKPLGKKGKNERTWEVLGSINSQPKEAWAQKIEGMLSTPKGTFNLQKGLKSAVGIANKNRR